MTNSPPVTCQNPATLISITYFRGQLFLVFLMLYLFINVCLYVSSPLWATHRVHKEQRLLVKASEIHYIQL